MSTDARRKGVLIAVGAVAAVTPDAMLLRWARTCGATAWQIAFFKMNIVGVLSFFSALYFSGGFRSLVAAIRAEPFALFVLSLLQVGEQLGFTFSFLTTDTARAMLFISLNPVWAALLGCWFLGDRLPRRTLGLLGAGLLSAFIVFLPSVLPASWTGVMIASDAEDAATATSHRLLSADAAASSDDHQPATLHGDLFALATGLCLASYVSYIRYCAKYRPSAAIDAAPSFGNLLAALVGLVMCIRLDGGVASGVRLQTFLPVVGVNAVLMTLFYVGFTLAPRYITGAEVALILLMETVCGPLWVFLRFGDAPNSWTMGGGAVLVVALAAHELAGLHESTKQMAAISRLSGSPPPARFDGATVPKIAPDFTADYQAM